jgi:hypothetical protein
MPEDAIHLREYTVVETSEFQDANPDGTITCPPGEETILAEYEPATDQSRVLLHAMGASDNTDVRYRLRYGSTEISFTAESPLGGINSPFSFTDSLGKPLTAGNGTVALTTLNDGGAAVDLAARLHLEVR